MAFVAREFLHRHDMYCGGEKKNEISAFSQSCAVLIFANLAPMCKNWCGWWADTSSSVVMHAVSVWCPVTVYRERTCLTLKLICMHVHGVGKNCIRSP